MILISHRGNINGRNPEKENHPDYIEEALNQGFDVEIDVWKISERWFLGHDSDQYNLPESFFKNKKLWFHAKNKESLYGLSMFAFDINYFWHDVDYYTLTSNGYIWTFPGIPLLPKSICLLPEYKVSLNMDICSGICSDKIGNYK